MLSPPSRSLLRARATLEGWRRVGTVRGNHHHYHPSPPLLSPPPPRSYRGFRRRAELSFEFEDRAAHAIGPHPRLPPCRIHSATSHRSRLHPMRNRDIHPPRRPVRSAPCRSSPTTPLPPSNHDTPPAKSAVAAQPLRPTPQLPPPRSFIPLVPTIPVTVRPCHASRLSIRRATLPPRDSLEA